MSNGSDDEVDDAPVIGDDVDGDGDAVLLLPGDVDQGGVEGGDEEMEDAGLAAAAAAAAAFPAGQPPRVAFAGLPLTPGDYVVHRPIANTTFGRVFLGSNQRTNELVAIKESSVTRMERPSMLEDPVQEVATMLRIAAAGGHESLLRMHAQLTDKAVEWHWMALEFCAGGELFEFATRFGRMPNAAARHVFRQVMEGVEFMHSLGICHLDISMENTLVVNDLNEFDHLNAESRVFVKINDFGMSRPFEYGVPFPAQPDSRHFYGKTCYAAPEVYARQAFHGWEADIYSCGSLLFHLLLALPPYVRPVADDARFQLIINGNVDQLLAHWGMLDLVNPDALDLIRLMMSPAGTRPTASQVLAHPYLN